MAGAFLVLSLCAADWPQWRGPNRDGASTAAPPPAWPEQLQRKWKITVGEGHASPVYAGGRLFVFAREAEDEIARAIDPADGKVVWEQRYTAPYKMAAPATEHGKGPKSTPVYSAGKLCTFGISGVLSCLDAGSGTVAWRKDFKTQYKQTSPTFGTAMSPVVDAGVLFAHTGGEGKGAVAAFDLNSGAEKWNWTGDGPAYASPLVLEAAGVRQVVTQSQRSVIGLAASTGELLWKIPFETSYEQNSITPVAYRDLLIISGLDKGVIAVRIGKTTKGLEPETVWQNAQAPMYMSTAVLAGDALYGFTHKNKGQFFCLDAKTGQTLWLGPARQGENAAILRQGDALLMLKNDGDLVVARANPKAFEMIRKYTVADSPTWAHLAPVDDGIVIKDKTSLSLWTWRSR